MSKHSTLKSLISEMVRKELKSILSEQSTSSSPTSSLSPGAQKALEQSKIAKQNKDVQKKRAAAKESMKGMSVEGVELDIEEQFSRMPGDKLQSDEGDFFDSTDLHGDDAAFHKYLDALVLKVLAKERAKPGFKDTVPGELIDKDIAKGIVIFPSDGRILMALLAGYDPRHDGGGDGRFSIDSVLKNYTRSFWQDALGAVAKAIKSDSKLTALAKKAMSGREGAFDDFDEGTIYGEQIRIDGDKRHSDEADFFDTSELEDYQDDLNNDYLGFDDDGDIGDSYRGADESWDDGYVPGSYRYVREQHNKKEDEISIDWDDSKRMELEQVDKPKQPVPYDDYQATDAEWDALKGEQEYQAGLDDEREEREYQRSGGGRRADWEWQY